MSARWPELSYEKGKDTYQTIHLFSQIVGKIKLAKLPWINHSWHVTLLITPYGITTGNIPDVEKNFQIDFDFTQHVLRISTDDHEPKQFSLEGLAVADFYQKVLSSLSQSGIEVKITLTPNELADPIPFTQDYTHATYDKEQVKALHKALLSTQNVLTQFRAEFKGKCSPVHFFWGSFDLAVSRFSGRTAPTHPGGIPNLPDWVAQEAYSHEVSSCGFWPGNDTVPFAAFYAYAYPEPPGFKEALVKPTQAYYDHLLREFILPYEAVRTASDPKGGLLAFLRTTFRAGAELGQWDCLSGRKHDGKYD